MYFYASQFLIHLETEIILYPIVEKRIKFVPSLIQKLFKVALFQYNSHK